MKTNLFVCLVYAFVSNKKRMGKKEVKLITVNTESGINEDCEVKIIIMKKKMFGNEKEKEEIDFLE